jgi:uncharacterized protein YutE (UPF0331/DUF86 family)
MIFLDNDRLFEKIDEMENYLRELVGFRNLLVHQYGRVDDSRAYSYLKIESKDFYEFIETIDKYIEQVNIQP